jgi:hypothetical protein
MPTASTEPKGKTFEIKGLVHCPLCTHTVEAMVMYASKGAKVTPGQRCPRCSSSLDAGFALRVDRAA